MKISKTVMSSFLIVILVVSFGYVAFTNPSLFDNIVNLPNTLLASSSVRIQGQGYADTSGEWRGDYWIATMLTDMEDQMGYYRFDSSEAAKSVNTPSSLDSDEKLNVQSIITVKITPLKPYYQRALVRESVNVYPATGSYIQNKITSQGQWASSVDKLDVSYLSFSGPWELHTPFRVQVLKNNVQIVEKTFDTMGATQAVELVNPSDNSEKVIVKDLGKLSSGYGQPDYGGDLIFFSGDTVFRKTSTLMNAIKFDGADYCYANYWFGGGSIYKSPFYGEVVRRAPDNSPGHYIRTSDVLQSNQPVADSDFPGSYRADDSWNFKVHALSASVFSDAHGGKSLINYLKDVRHETVIGTNTLNHYNSGFEITSDSKLKVYLPYKAASSLITLQISSELADTVVWEPPVSDIRLSSVSWVGGNSQIGDSAQLKVVLQQFSSVTSTATVTVSYGSGHPIQTTPSSTGVTLGSGESTTVYFQFTNTAADALTNGNAVVNVYDEFGKLADTKSVGYTLVPRATGSTSLSVFAVNKETNEAISGLTIVCKYGENSPTQITSSGSCSFDLSGYQGPVTVSSVETLTYKAASVAKDISEGINTVYLFVEPHGYVDPEGDVDWFMIALIFAIIVSVVAVVGVVATKQGKGKRGRKRRL